ncbi:DUF5931 domain-containing protein [Pseudonocardia eucalypti]|uniref:DUF5931 domain-containing protein n=1 Tax=Pseudonocardia eucalypti TaxID=648755 RepID=A0ABP9Q9W8_9PSEU|nr:signal transduction histidine kinase [Pseudonocardia eucalypti]
MSDRAPEQMLDPLWRGLVGYRVIALGYAGVLVLRGFPEYRWPLGALLVLGGLACWTAVTGVGYLRPVWPGRGWLAVADLVVSVAAVASTLAVETPARIASGVPVLPTVWVAGPAIALALVHGPLFGVLGGLVVQASVAAVRGHLGAPELTDLLLIVASALAVGYAATVLRRSAAQLRDAVALRAAVAERERLARSIHDGVLQVLSQVSRRGRSLGGAAAELGELAGEQEVALRTLMTTDPPSVRPDGSVDLANELAALATSRVTVSTPATAVPLPEAAAREVTDAVRTALANVRTHVGAEAPAWVLVERLDDRVEVSVRDDGPGIPAGRLAAAAAEGRLGVTGGIVGRIEGVGGSARCVTGPGLGCEWIFELPVGGGSR